MKKEQEFIKTIYFDADYIGFISKQMTNKEGYECISEVDFSDYQYEDTVKLKIQSDHTNIQLFKRAIKFLVNQGYKIKYTESTDDDYRENAPLGGGIIMIKNITSISE